MPKQSIGNLVVNLALNSQKFQKSIGKNRSETRKWIKGLQRSLRVVRQDFVSFGKVTGVALAAVGFAAKKSLDAYEQQEKAVAGLRQALESTGRTCAGFEKRIIDTAKAIQAMGITGDEVTIEAAKMGATFENITDDIFPRMLKVAADWSAATGQDMVSAVSNLGRASAGQFGLLSRYGIIIDENTKKSGDFSAVLDVIEKKFGGQQEAMRSTTFGSMQAMKNMWGDLNEQAGEFVAISITPLLGEMTELFGDLGEVLEQNKGVIRVYSQEFGEVLVTGLRKASTAVKFLVENWELAAEALIRINSLGQLGLDDVLGSTKAQRAATRAARIEMEEYRDLLETAFGSKSKSDLENYLFDLEYMAETAKGPLTEGWKGLVALANQYLASLNNVANAPDIPVPGGGGGGDAGGDSSGERAKQAAKARVDYILDGLKTEEELIWESYREREKILQEAADKNIEIEGGLSAALVAIREDRDAQLLALTQDTVNEYDQIWKDGLLQFNSLFADALVTSLATGESFADKLQTVVNTAIQDTIQQLIRLRLEQALTNAMLQSTAVGGGLSGLLAGAGTFLAGAFPVVAGIAAVAGIANAVKNRNKAQGHTGIDYVPDDGPVQLRSGEAVLTPQASRNLNAMLEGGMGARPAVSESRVVNITINGFVSDHPQIISDLQDLLDREGVQRARREA